MFRAESNARFPHLTAVFQALFVTFLWSTSWVLIKIGLVDIPPLIFAGLRYGLAFLCLLPVFLLSGGAAEIRTLTKTTWLQLLSLGVIFYSVTQGAQFLGLFYLPTVAVNILLSFTTIVVALLGIGLLSERPFPQQWLGMLIAIVGILFYFYPLQIPQAQFIGFIIVGIGVLANAGSAILGRALNRQRRLRPLTITTISMGTGATLLLFVAIVTQPFPNLSWQSWGIIGWLAVVNTAFAFTLWNHSLQTLTATESSVINNTMGIQIPIMAVIFLGESLSSRQIIGLAVAIAGTLLVHLNRGK